MNLASVLVLCVLAVFPLVSAKVVVIGKNMTRSFDDVEANFTPKIKSSGECGMLYTAEPLDACSDLTNKVEKDSNVSSAFALIIRGGCSFEDKIKRAQKAGFKAAIVYDNEDGGILVTMAGNPSGVKIYGVFISKESGEAVKNFAGSNDMEVWLIPSFENSAWSIMAISFISLLAMSAVLASCFFIRRHRVRRRRPQASLVREFRGMSSRLVQAMPSLIFTAVLEDNCTSSTCAICLEDYSVGDKLRILPCRHKFHAFCVDSWLTTWRTFCPVCKRDARTSSGDPPASESTPLLSSSPASSYSFLVSPSRSPLSSNIPIAPTLECTSVSVSPSQSNASSYRRSPPIPVSRSSVDLRNAYSQRSGISHLGSSPHSLGYQPTSSLHTRYMSPYRPSPSNASPALVGSSSHRGNLVCYSKSAGTFSPFASANSLPDY